MMEYDKPSAAFTNSLTSINSKSKLVDIIAVQANVFAQFDKCNSKLVSINELSTAQFSVLSAAFRKHVAVLVSTQRNLSNLFRRIRALKAKLRERHPVETAEAERKYVLEDEEEEE